MVSPGDTEYLLGHSDTKHRNYNSITIHRSEYARSSNVLSSQQEAALRPKEWYGTRHTQCLLLFFLLAIGYAMRVNLSVGIVAMTDKTASSNPDVPTYDWNDKSIVLSSFFWGYVVLQVLAGYCATQYGAKWFLTGAMMVNSLACMGIPFMAAEFGSKGVMACRVLQGLSQGFFFPSVHGLLGQWVPTGERSQLGTFVYSGAPFGTIVALPLTGLISASELGWPVSFYLFGIVGMIWTVWWCFAGYDNPSKHPTISEQERYYVESSLGHLKKKILPTPWKAIFTSLPMWAIVVANFGQNWGYATLLTEIPNYLHEVMGYNVKSNSMLSAAPYLCYWIISMCIGPLSDVLINRKIVTRGTSRKIFNSIGIVGPAIALTLLSYLPDDEDFLSVMVLIFAVGINGSVSSGFQVNHIDISPNFSGILMGITNGSSNIFSIIAPLAVQVIVTDESDKSLWRIVFLIASIIYVLSAIFFNMFASGEIQQWNYEQPENDKMRKLSHMDNNEKYGKSTYTQSVTEEKV
ncbi:putative inorganic phosphate cotransporter isoform X1 [Coccinella septempunctata]|uniref:putative inorganic phosphate cotransporter isoform X1 n=2 Tax=Coccinella septempunctata TaxID=41139 RepID=UPI001D076F0B|nr:putative inorganic phosphate cotransporter isoform X1 [Coccinella septempunctata]